MGEREDGGRWSLAGVLRLAALALLLLCSLGAWGADPVIEVQGVNGDAKDNLEAYLGKLTDDDLKNWRATQLRLRSAARDAMESVGYYEATFDLKREDGRVILVVTAGQPVVVHSINLSFEGDAQSDIAFGKVAKEPPLKIGEVFNQGRYEAFKARIQNLALERGYFDAEWTTHKATVDLQSHQVDIELLYSSGVRYRFGAVRFEAQDKQSRLAIKDKVMQKLVPFKTGDPYDSAMVIKFNKVLLDSRYFGNVRVRVEPEKATDTKVVPVVVQASTANPNAVDAGVGYSTDVGARVTLAWRRPLLNESGHGVEFDTELSQIARTFNAKYTIPLTNPINDTLQFLYGVQRIEIDQTIPTYSTMWGVQRQINRDSGWQQIQSLRFQRESYVIDTTEGNTDLLMPGLTLSRVRAKGGSIDPYWGDSQFYQVQGASQSAFSAADMLWLRTGFRFLRTVQDRHMFIFRLDGGAILTNNFDKIPPTMRFYAGGDQSVRGYDYQSLGPKDANGIVVGGHYLATGSAEYDYLFLPRWRGAVFVDGGNAFDTVHTQMKIGTGFGVRWLSPVGAIRLDFAFGVSDPGAPFRLHFSMGTPL